ncbi:uncharacterized protein EV420DRAFT_1644601 [Desarmillaria tabescens]|uniref:Ubiquitin-like protease family profile domain-containing protein n=1 Tax=Armillaria tabescens TaxID=1929756 RepID=A0AA39KAS9_ARMTA|nr:uncharacterized protein EV420DRAFT_1644601 [Desarmillaria tabescens]KAK0455368.1 hypothetical protein EV420DRAFT_1644601 [Desarmillaria tabescens]
MNFQSLLNATSSNSIHILPTFFHQELSLAFECQKFTKQFQLLCDLFLQNPPTYLAFVYNKHGVHWASCLISLKHYVIFYGDSLKWEADDNMCCKVQWLFGDITEIQDQWQEDILPISSQLLGSGSCGPVFVDSEQVITVLLYLDEHYSSSALSKCLTETQLLADGFTSKSSVLLVTVQQLSQESFLISDSYDPFFDASVPVVKDLILKNADKPLADGEDYGLDMDLESDSDIALDDNLSMPSK